MRIIRDLEAAKSLLLERAQVERAGEAYETVQQILGEVRSRGDSALFDYTREIDGVELARLEVTREEIAQSRNVASKELVSAL